jgi:N-glycosylase/DNA lyase
MPKDKVMRVTTRRYTVQITDDMHPTWKAELDSSKTHLDVEIHGREAAVTNSHVSHGLRSTGLGEKLYRSMLDHLLSEDVRVINSDISMSINSIRLWRSLERKGYRLVQRVPDEEMELDPGSGQYHDATGKNRSLFAVVGKQERQPDLPQTREEVLREADEARNLGEHMAACTKGKR